MFGKTITLGRNFIFKRYKHVLPDLPYDYNALEPVISAGKFLIY